MPTIVDGVSDGDLKFIKSFFSYKQFVIDDDKSWVFFSIVSRPLSNVDDPAKTDSFRRDNMYPGGLRGVVFGGGRPSEALQDRGVTKRVPRCQRRQTKSQWTPCGQTGRPPEIS